MKNIVVLFFESLINCGYNNLFKKSYNILCSSTIESLLISLSDKFSQYLLDVKDI